MSSIKPTQSFYTGNPYITGSVSMDAKVHTEKKEPVKTGLKKADDSASSYDVVSISQDGSHSSDLSHSVQKMLDNLQQLYPNIQITYSKETGMQSLEELAAAAGKGYHAIISQGFLDRMSSNREEFFRCSQILSEVLSRLNSNPAVGGTSAGVYLDKDKASFWQVASENVDYQSAINQVDSQSTSLLERLQSMSQDKNTSNHLYKAGTSKNYDVASVYAKVARATSKAGVRAAMSSARHKIVSLQMAASFGDPRDVVKARAAVRSLNKLLMRGERKIKKLDKEQLLTVRKKRAQAKEEARKARELEREQESHKRKRKAGDHTIMEEGRRDKRYIDSRGNTYGNCTPLITSTDPAVNIQAMGSPGVAESGISSSNVVVSAEVSF